MKTTAADGANADGANAGGAMAADGADPDLGGMAADGLGELDGFAASDGDMPLKLSWETPGGYAERDTMAAPIDTPRLRRGRADRHADG